MAKLIEDRHTEMIIYTPEELSEVLKRDTAIGRDNSALREGDAGWYGTGSFEEAEKLREYGDKESHSRIKKIKLTADKIMADYNAKKLKYENDVVGFQPIVANAIMGLPQSMVNTRTQKVKSKILNIVLNASMTGETPKEYLEVLGVVLLSGIEALELTGVGVNLYVGKVSAYGSSRCNKTGFMVQLKKADEQLNTYKLSYYLGNASFLRRTGFRVHEVEDRLTDITWDGYGSGAVDYQHGLSDFIQKHIPDSLYFSIGTGYTDADEIEAYLKDFKNKVD